MVCYVTLGANDIKRAAEFYQRLFDVIGARRVRDFETFVAWQQNETSPFFAVISPFNKKEATPGNGTMIAIRVESETVVDQIHKLALELGGINEGIPGVRTGNFYSSYFRDLDGNKLNVFTTLPKFD